MKKLNLIAYQQRIGVEKIISDGKVYPEGVERKRKMLASGECIGDVLVIKHPSQDLFAVLDGHHALEAYRMEGAKEIECSVIPDYIGPLFYITKRGGFQPGPKYTEYVRVPFKEAKEYLREFLMEPEKLKQKQ
jgi:hypothetical protein